MLIEVLGGDCKPQFWGVGVNTVRKILVSSYRPSIVTFTLYLRVSDRDIATFVLKHATFSHPTSSLPKISLCSLQGD